jgi:hypothetical protein
MNKLDHDHRRLHSESFEVLREEIAKAPPFLRIFCRKGYLRMVVHNMPYAAAPFVNRVSEIAEITNRLTHADCRLLTLVGPGGMARRVLPCRLRRTVPPGCMVFTHLGASGTPEANPVLVIENSITDASTGTPVRADVYVVVSEDAREPLPDELVVAGNASLQLKDLSDVGPLGRDIVIELPTAA